MKTVTIRLSIKVRSSIGHIFSDLSDIDMLDPFKKILLVPNFAYLSNHRKFRRPGSEQVLYFEDANSARVVFLTFVPEMSFSLKVHQFTSFRFSRLQEVEICYDFIDLGSGALQLVVAYHFRWRDVIWALLFKFLAKQYLTHHISAFINEAVRKAGYDVTGQY